MKPKLLFGSIMLGLALTSTAQITVYRSDIGNLIGAIIINANDTLNLNALSPGNAGTNQTWNLTGMGNDYQDTMLFQKPNGLNCSEDFPTATLALVDSGSFIYGYDDNNVLTILGVCAVLLPPDTSSVIYTPSQKRMTFPSTFNTTFSGQTKAKLEFPFSPPPPDSARLVLTINYTSVIDGWGTVTIPTGTYPSLRQKYTTYEVDSVYVHIPGSGWMPVGNPKYDTTIEYSWWSKTNPFIASITTDWSGHIEKANYLLYSNLGFKEAVSNTPAYSVFPNPSDGKFTILLNNENKNTIEIFDVMGEKVSIVPENRGQTTNTIDLSRYPNGIYFIRISDGERMYTEKIVLL